MSEVYLQQLNDFGRKFILRGGYNPTREDFMLYPMRLDNIKASVFESLMLFDRSCFKVVGENVPLAVLINEFGVAGLEKLIDQGALSFLHWKMMVGNMVDNIPGIIPLVSGAYSDGPYVDPEESITIGLKLLRDQPNKKQRQTILRKARDLYVPSSVSDASETTAFVTSAFSSGKLKAYGLDNDALDLYALPKVSKDSLVKCAEDLLEYKQVLSAGFATLENSKFVSLFNDTAGKINKFHVGEAVSVMAELEGFPDLRAVYKSIDSPMQKVIGLREKKNVMKFRKWLSEATIEDKGDISLAYMDAIANPSGFFETKAGKFTRSVATTIIGAGVGAVSTPFGATVGTMFGAVAGKAVEPVVALGLDLVDEYLISGFMKGWTPRMFFTEIKKSGVRVEPVVN
ncbi:glycine zipper family protein [Pseudomonas fluorescens]|uniref:glycine zipper family protein n=1 Tax=Pseudomonas fluorescens TaxID=294 RepID=UPI00382E81FE